MAQIEMNLQIQSPIAILQRIDTIVRELETLREIIVKVMSAQKISQLPEDNLGQKLFGVLGQGTWAEYDFNLDWQRFEV